MLKTICIIPARGGSKGVPKKNIRKIAGKPLLGYVIENLKKGKNFSNIIVSTEDEEIAKIRFKNGFSKGTVKVNTLNYFLKKYYEPHKKIDLLKIDVEGEELNVLKSIDLKIYKPRIISIEIHNHKFKKKNDINYFKFDRIYKFLILKGYKLIWRNRYSFIFRKRMK